MHKPDERMMTAIFDHLQRRVRLAEPALDHPAAAAGDLDDLLRDLITPEGNDPVSVLEVYRKHLARGVISCDSPRFLAFIGSAPTRASLLFDMVVSAASLQGISWLEASGAVAAENQALRFIADLAGLPAQAGGCFVTGATFGTLSALVVAREVQRSRLGHGGGHPVRVAVADQAHFSVPNGIRIIGAEPLVVRTDGYRLTGSDLLAALDRVPAGETVIAAVATAGTTNAGLVDDLAGIADVCRRRGMWLHVDAAYGGAALLASSVRDRFAGIEHADSLVIDPHKWLFAPYDCSALLYRDPHLARGVFAPNAPYIEIIEPAEREWNPSDYAHHFTRRARGLALWYSLAVHGTDAYREAVEAGLRRARHTAAMIRNIPYLDLVMEPELSVVLFRRRGWTSEQYHAWSHRLLAEQVAFVAPTTWQGETVARLAFIHPETDAETVAEILGSMAECRASAA